jgi:uncharacterized protein YaiI (UPF0178 family)/dihydrofolate reductase
VSAVWVDGRADVADQYIAAHAGPGDLVVTQGVPLAALLVPGQATVLDPRGEEHTAETIGERLSVRDFMERARMAGAVTGGPPPYDARAKQAFAGALDRGAGATRKWKEVGMARLVFGMNQSLDGYVDHEAFAPGPALFRHFIEEARGQAGSVYGRRMYEIMRYWDDDHPEWDAEEQAFAAAWRSQPKWVVSRSLTSVGPNATLVGDDLEGAMRELKAGRDGEIEVAGPRLAQSLTELGLIDEYRIYLHPVVLGHGQPYFGGPRPRLRLMANDRMGEDVVRLVYAPA